MKPLRPGLAILLCAGCAVAASAAEQSLTRSVTNAFDTVVIETTNAAAAATKAATNAAKSALAPVSTGKKKKKSNDGEQTADKQSDAGKIDADATKDDGKVKNKSKAAANAGQKVASKRDLKSKSGDDAKPAQTATSESKEPADSAGSKPDAKTEAKSDAKTDGKTPDPAKPATTATKTPPVPTEWPAADVELAKARCTQLLKTVDAVTIPEPAFREGECGAMAPVKLMSIGKSPEVTFDPAPLVTCDMVVGLHKWMKENVQPLARKHLGGDVIKIETMSDYSCRMAYGRVGNKLSEHGKANALDIRGFTTSKGKTAIVFDSWGQTKRDIERQIAAAKATAEKAEALKAEAERAETSKIEAAKLDALKNGSASKTALETTGRDGAASVPRTTIVDGLPKDAATKETFGYANARLGGPKQTAAAAKSDDARDSTAKRKKAGANKDAVQKEASIEPPGQVMPTPGDAGTTAFLHEAHDAACQIFGTTLGPEANDAHRNHFHVDMAERKVKKICD